ncbi:hypothetical protein MYCTH_2294996 [Thermothelomyces thermophilus ATCC 42464]|uniref:Wax synthase domain-containing protein n=1 Tax=Thermothelomyces thermophilus (strain ATCC 42464 / BCRC 31852 / DSM 1799) TaxID=573729 RepID=G2Q368_THET4|nr:uncharacterized protein MYCTH_2294996 [Thermothelomyces thermophilus ATCC 42464]AEO53531.1 hypothetical protein MYCTH_2294996 [Thermothelomyces thermophilus ATCC 42464]
MAANLVSPGHVASGSDQQPFNLGVYYQKQYRAAFRAALEAGEVRPLVIPWSFVGSFFLPLLYLSIPHVNRPWLYHMRWLVAAAVIYLNVRLLQTTSAINEAVAYATGLLAAWGTINALRLLIFTRPQWDAARVERRPRRPGVGLKEGMEKQTAMVSPDESVGTSLAHSEYFWQPFPATGSLLARLGWTADLITAFRGAGWNCSISSIPHPPFPPKKALEGEPVRLDLVPLASRTGTARSSTYASFLRSRLLEFSLSYLTIDLLTTTIRRDPYFVLGPDYRLHSYPLPAFYSRLPFPQLTISFLLRSLPALAGIIAGLHLYYSFLQLTIVFPLRSLFGVRAELWQHPSLFGGFVPSVLDRGLAGFWGGWWHQTFRAGFVAPARWLLRQHGRVHHHHHHHHHHHRHHNQSHTSIRENKTARMLLKSFLAFTLSGLVHSAGGHTSVPETTRFWTPIVFFVLQPVGIILQAAAASLAKRLASSVLARSEATAAAGHGAPKKRIPRWLCRTANLLFTTLWLHLTAWGLIDDMSRAGVWLFEPVPVSPFRMMGFGAPGNTDWWRWDGVGYGLGWYTVRGGRWWESGVTL